jgi:hypothetical protein
MGKTIVVIDGMGGGVGAQLISKLRERWAREVEILALGANSAATERMIKAGADRGASGENAVVVSASRGDIIMGPIGIVIPGSMMGEISSAMVKAVLSAPGERILIPLQQDHFRIVGIEPLTLGKMMEKTLDLSVETLGPGNREK